ncbi:helix-turn-helix transcriptional regulator [Mucilaginibacter jinjuensis]|uniref:Helix-turn-helix domain-containing protein n=1 Tax=Mucilaginibacter jinjuensis TaxID=1176721 RepID=A0ABY7T5M2_9SPHI|nr:helix-turn-helix domain-containing protein [Mucilaginibacter jinjuensis]WCT11007.1 helix-turn-helix domain-containing protein [Mucilaginibacter jinjuensis]
MTLDELITKKDLENFKAELFELLKPIVVTQSFQRQKWLRSKDVRTMLKISPGTLSNLQKDGTLTPRKIGKILFYKAEEIEKLLNAPEKKSPKKLI